MLTPDHVPSRTACRPLHTRRLPLMCDTTSKSVADASTGKAVEAWNSWDPLAMHSTPEQQHPVYNSRLESGLPRPAQDPAQCSRSKDVVRQYFEVYNSGACFSCDDTYQSKSHFQRGGGEGKRVECVTLETCPRLDHHSILYKHCWGGHCKRQTLVRRQTSEKKRKRNTLVRPLRRAAHSVTAAALPCQSTARTCIRVFTVRVSNVRASR